MTSRTKPSKSSQSSRKPKRKGGSRKKARRTKEVGLAKVKDDFSRYLKLASREEILITRHGRPAGILIGFETRRRGSNIALRTTPSSSPGSLKREMPCALVMACASRMWATRPRSPTGLGFSCNRQR